MNEVLVGPIGDRDADSHRRAKSSKGFEVGFGSVGGLVVHDLITPLIQQSTPDARYLQIHYCFAVLVLFCETTAFLTKSALRLLHIRWGLSRNDCVSQRSESQLSRVLTRSPRSDS